MSKQCRRCVTLDGCYLMRDGTFALIVFLRGKDGGDLPSPATRGPASAATMGIDYETVFLRRMASLVSRTPTATASKWSSLLVIGSRLKPVKNLCRTGLISAFERGVAGAFKNRSGRCRDCLASRIWLSEPQGQGSLES
jgi:hypothetical protein